MQPPHTPGLWRLSQPLPTFALSLLMGMSVPAVHALDINQASEADLDAIRGSGPALTARILQARERAPFESWQDLMRRVKGIGPATARKWHAQGVTVNGEAPADSK
jgi:competence protein ComEA